MTSPQAPYELFTKLNILVTTGLTPLPKLDTKMQTLIGLLCDSIYDHLVFTVQDNSSGPGYRHKLQEFLTAKQTEFYSDYILTKYSAK